MATSSTRSSPRSTTGTRGEDRSPSPPARRPTTSSSARSRRPATASPRPADLILVSEPKVFALHGERVAALLGCDAPILLPEGEAAKHWDVLHDLLAQLAERGASRSTRIVALGGGSVGDVVGLAASLFKRGCPVIHLPTTLLAQVDSAVGGKTAIDAFGEKNLDRQLPPARAGRRRSRLPRHARPAPDALGLCRNRQIWR